MHLVAFRPEYQITVEPLRNRIFYKHYAEPAQATALPHYLTDWEHALAATEPGFTILSDLTALPTVSAALSELLVQAQHLVVRHGVRLVAAVHVAGSETYRSSQVVGAESALPVCTFTDLWEADKYLDEAGAAAVI
jgi:hypothetical protein